jgi:hypothetical protein
VREVPLPQAPLLALDDEDALPAQHEEVLLRLLRVVLAVGLSRLQHLDVDAEVRELAVALEVVPVAGLVTAARRHVGHVEDVPAVALRLEAGVGPGELRLGYWLAAHSGSSEGRDSFVPELMGL